MKYEVDENGVMVIEITIGEILSKLAILEDPEAIIKSVGHNYAKKESAKIIRKLLGNVMISIPSKEIEKVLTEVEKTGNLYVVNMIKYRLKEFFERTERK